MQSHLFFFPPLRFLSELVFQAEMFYQWCCPWLASSAAAMQAASMDGLWIDQLLESQTPRKVLQALHTLTLVDSRVLAFPVKGNQTWTCSALYHDSKTNTPSTWNLHPANTPAEHESLGLMELILAQGQAPLHVPSTAPFCDISLCSYCTPAHIAYTYLACTYLIVYITSQGANDVGPISDRLDNSYLVGKTYKVHWLGVWFSKSSQSPR